MITITPEETHLLGRFVHERTGIVVDETKGYLLETRLQSMLAAQGVNSFKELYLKAKSGPPDGLASEIVDAVTTNETYFFRDNTPFDLLRFKIIPDLIDRRKRANAGGGRIPLRFWSAACSSGQEVYSIAMTLCELLPDIDRYDISILGTDISRNVLAKASYGKYSDFEIQRGLPGPMLSRYFTKVADGWKISDRLRGMANFKLFNLRSDFNALGQFDIIFCRNVAIYFSSPDKAMLFKRIARVLAKDGSLIVGGSESLSGLALDFVAQQHLKGIYYQLQEFFLEHATDVQSPRHYELDLPPAPSMPKPPPVEKAMEAPPAKHPGKGKRRTYAAIPALTASLNVPGEATTTKQATTLKSNAVTQVAEEKKSFILPSQEEVLCNEKPSLLSPSLLGQKPLKESLQDRLMGRSASGGETLLGRLAGHNMGGESLLAGKSRASGKPGLLSELRGKVKKGEG